MFKSFISECFSAYKTKDVGEAKRLFGVIWGVCASKTIRTKDEDIRLTWRELSAELAQLFNEWYNVKFTTDAFLNVFDHTTKFGQDIEYDEAVNAIINHPDCIGIFIINQPQLVSGVTVETGICETNLVTGELGFYKCTWSNGKMVSKEKIDSDTYENICFGG